MDTADEYRAQAAEAEKQEAKSLQFGPKRGSEPGRGRATDIVKPHRFPPDVIRRAVWLYFRFALSVRNATGRALAGRFALSRRLRLMAEAPAANS